MIDENEPRPRGAIPGVFHVADVSAAMFGIVVSKVLELSSIVSVSLSQEI